MGHFLGLLMLSVVLILGHSICNYAKWALCSLWLSCIKTHSEIFCLNQSTEDSKDFSIKSSSVVCSEDGNGERKCSLTISVNYMGEESSLDLSGGQPQITNGFRPAVYIRSVFEFVIFISCHWLNLHMHMHIYHQTH